VKVSALHLVQAVVEVLLKQIVPEPVHGQALTPQPLDALGPHQAMSFLQLATQLPHKSSLIQSLGAGDRFSDEILALHTRNGQGLSQFRFQPANALLDHAFHPSRQGSPVKCWSFSPLPRPVPGQIPSLLHVAQQLDGEQRMASRVAVQRLSETLVQPVGLGIQQGIDELPALAHLFLADFDLDIPVVAL